MINQKIIHAYKIPEGAKVEQVPAFPGNPLKFVVVPTGYRLRLWSLLQSGDGRYPMADGIEGGQSIDITREPKSYAPGKDLGPALLFGILGQLVRLEKAHAKFEEEQARRKIHMEQIKGNPDRKRQYDYYLKQNRQFIFPFGAEWVPEVAETAKPSEHPGKR